MKKKGFTLIELLAVIVILAIIALIAVPIVLNIIEDTKNSATLRSADFYIDAVELSIAKSILDGGSIDGTYSVESNGNICKNGNNCITVEVLGDIPSSGSTITIANGQISDVSLNYDDKTVVKNDNKLVFSGENNNNNNDNNVSGTDKVLEEAKALILAVENAIAKEKESDSDFNPYGCSLIDKDSIECSCSKLVYNEELGYEEWTSFSKELKINLNFKKVMSGSLSIYEGKVDSTYNNGIIIGDNTFIKYSEEEIFMIPEITEEYAIAQANKYIEAIEKAVADELEEDPTLEIDMVVDAGNRQATVVINEKFVKLQFDGLRPDILAGSCITIENGKVVPELLYMDFGSFYLCLNEDGSFSVVEF